MKQQMWTVKDKNGQFYPTLHLSRANAIEAYSNLKGMVWEACKKRGVRAVKVVVTEQGQEAFYLVTVNRPEDYQPLKLFRSKKKAKVYANDFIKDKRLKVKCVGTSVIRFTKDHADVIYEVGKSWGGKYYDKDYSCDLTQTTGRDVEAYYGIKGVELGLDLT